MLSDMINAPHAAPDERTRLPEEFFDESAREIMDRVLMEEENAGCAENSEYRTLGIGPMLSEVVQRMVSKARSGMLRDSDTRTEGKNATMAPIALFRCHDSTLAATLVSLGALGGETATWRHSSLPWQLSCSASEKGRMNETGSK